ncbi:MAG: polysaccharide deacetylase family protein [Pseudomonadota bacterium]|jgi:peptidoglycan/xylan/chitin deacetylase (PgdA/CDA1 family)|nr:polysaccharide deacetylase family protein [Pseudomonadota bacterium]
MNMTVKQKLKDRLGRAAEMAGLLRRDLRSKMVVVTFHRVNDWMEQDGITCGSAKFEAFCNFFRTHFQIVRLSEQVAGCRAGRFMGGTLSITFDDGYRDNFEVAAPILRRLGLPAAFFVTTGFLGTDYIPPWDRHLARQPGWMSWDQVRALRDQDFEIGAHTDLHVNLAAMEPSAIRTELTRCRTKFKQELGELPALFAYPFGGQENISTCSIELVREVGFQCCLGAFGGVNRSGADPFHLNRISIGGWYATPHQFALEVLLRRA